MTIVKISLIAAAILYIFLLAPNLLIEKKEISMYLTVGDHVGVNVDTDALWFGTVSPEGVSSRFVTVTNNDTVAKNVHFDATGNLSSWIALPKDAVLEPNGQRNFTITASVPENASYGNYTGKLLITFKR